MIWSIPSSVDEILINTPLKAKSVRYVYFENKQGGLFLFKSVPDSISISIDGKQICRNLVMLPFCTGSSDGIRRNRWQDVAISCPLNVSNSQVRISGVRNNDFNIVFVLSDESVDENIGIDYYESHVLRYKSDYECDDLLRSDMHTSVRDAVSGEEQVLSLEYAPEGFFVYNSDLEVGVFSMDFPRSIAKLNYKPFCLLDMMSGDNESVARGINMSLVSCTDKIPHSKAYYEFGEAAHKNISVKVSMIEDANILNQQVILFFKSRQLR